VSTTVKAFRIIGFLEGLSFLLLLFIAMPLKYMMNMPLMVTIVGAAHGALFILYIGAVFYLKLNENWSYKKAFLACVASVVPFGPFIFDAKLLKDEPVTKGF
jgi:integral membrane protein